MKLRGLGVVILVLAMVASMAGLAGADETEASTTPTTVAPGYDTSFQPGFAGELITFVLFWGVQADVDPIVYPPSPCLEDEESTDTTTVCLDVAGPNGQVNHGTFVSSFVHWLKGLDDGELSEALSDYGPRGKSVREAAHSYFPNTDDESSIFESNKGLHKGWSNSNNPHHS